MPWYAWVYLFYLSALVIYAAFDDLREGDPFWVVLLDVLEGALWWVYFAFWYRDSMPVWLGRLLPIVFVADLVWHAVRARQAIRKNLRPTPRFTMDEMRRGVIAGGVVALISVAPAFIIGARLIWRTLTAPSL